MTPVQPILPLDIEWRLIPGFPDYEVREDSTIRRATPWRGPVPMPAGKIRKQCTDPRSGYKYVALHRDGKQFRLSVHGIVAAAFYGPRPAPDHEVAHNDGDRGNNHYLNLRWDTHDGNMKDLIAHGTDNRGEKHWNAKLSREDVAEIRRRARLGEKRRLIAACFGISKNHVTRITRGERWGS